MKKRLVVILFSLALGSVLPTGVKGQVFSDDALKFSQVINWIDKYYVDSVSIFPLLH